jgi:hypothetical protein
LLFCWGCAKSTLECQPTGCILGIQFPEIFNCQGIIDHLFAEFREAFDFFDVNQDGYITTDEVLSRLLKITQS